MDAGVGTGKMLSVSSGFRVNDNNSGNNYALTLTSNTNGVINPANDYLSMCPRAGLLRPVTEPTKGNQQVYTYTISLK